MSLTVLALVAVLVLGAALAAATLGKLMHAALSFAVSFVGVAALYFLLGAEFVGLVQVFVYVGAVAVLIVFTILLTRREMMSKDGVVNWSGVLIALFVFGGMLWAVIATPDLAISAPAMEPLTVKRIGEVLMNHYIWPLLCVGLLLTVALLGALIIAMEEK
jgi:NADH-quinone oxidoreductase subunit J